MTTPITTCNGWSQQKVGGRCPKRDSCRRFLERDPSPNAGYPQDGFLCTVGAWGWFVESPPCGFVAVIPDDSKST